MSKRVKRHRSHNERKGQRKMQARKGSHPAPGYKISEAKPGFVWFGYFDSDMAGIPWVSGYLPE